jgi:hypothetical protein
MKKRPGFVTHLINRKLKHHREARSFYHVRVVLPEGKKCHCLFSHSELKRAIERADRNPEDIP